MTESTRDISVGIILASFNSEKYLRETIDSVLAQTHQNFELIVVDDRSSDSSTDLVTSYQIKDSRVQLVVLDQNSGGPARPRNIGLDIVGHDYVAFIDSDDVWHPNKLSLQLEVMRTNRLNFSSTRLLSFSDMADIEFSNIHNSDVSALIDLNKLLKKNILATSSVMIDRGLVNQIRFSELEKHVAIEDYKAWLELHQSQCIRSARLDAQLVYYRVRSDSISRSKLTMARKIYTLLSEIEVNGSKLGLKRYYYFLTYLIGSLESSMYS